MREREGWSRCSVGLLMALTPTNRAGAGDVAVLHVVHVAYRALKLQFVVTVVVVA